MNELTKTMLKTARQALPHAYAPYSNFRVAACLRGSDNRLFVGVNVENCSYGLTLCAEASAIGQMITSGEHHILDLVVLANNNEICTPCGACRQRLYEFSSPETRIFLCNQHDVLQTLTMDELLPFAFRHKRPNHE